MVFSTFRMNNVPVLKFLNVYIREEGTIKYCLRLFSNGEKNFSSYILFLMLKIWK